MSLTLHLEGAGERRPVTGERFTIGRAQENDWILPDPEQHLSRQHCVIERRGAGFCVVDTSSNGVFVNGESAPLGRGHERMLGDGDRLQLGTYVMAVALAGPVERPSASERGQLFDPVHVPKAAPKEGAGRVFDHTWVGSREAFGAADHRASPTGRPDPRYQTPPEHRPVDLGKIVPAPGLFDSRPPAPAPTVSAPEETAPPSASLFDSEGTSTRPPEPVTPEPVTPEPAKI
jgi:type VI secretion system FHA domain protein